MQIKANTPDQYVDQLPEDRKEPIDKLKNSIPDYHTEGFTETAGYCISVYLFDYLINLQQRQDEQDLFFQQ